MDLLKYFVLMSIVYTSNSTRLENQAKFIENAMIHQMFEMLRTLIKLGDEANGIPVLDPLFMNFINRCFDGEMYKVTSDINNGYLTRLGDFELKSFVFSKNDTALTLHLRFPSIEMRAETYKLSGDFLGVFPLAGEGLLSYRMDDLHFWGKIFLRQSPNGKSILLDKLENAHYNIGGIESATDYDGNFDHILNAMTEDLLADYLNRFHQYVIATGFARHVASLNRYLSYYETWRLIAIIT